MKKYPAPVKAISTDIVCAVIKIYDTVKIDLLPTPSKSHYTFNLRDIWKIYQGICSGSP